MRIEESENQKVEIELKLLEKVAEYYEFPLAVFFGNLKCFSQAKNRSEAIKAKLDRFERIKDIVYEDD